MGGLVAALLYTRHPGRFKALVLLAPALHWKEAGEVKLPPQEQVTVIHGTKDDIVPLDAVAEVCRAQGVDVTVVDDGHRLKDSHDVMLEAVRSYLTSARRLPAGKKS